jgi:hypothetical protein
MTRKQWNSALPTIPAVLSRNYDSFIATGLSLHASNGGENARPSPYIITWCDMTQRQRLAYAAIFGWHVDWLATLRSSVPSATDSREYLTKRSIVSLTEAEIQLLVDLGDQCRRCCNDARAMWPGHRGLDCSACVDEGDISFMMAQSAKLTKLDAIVAESLHLRRSVMILSQYRAVLDLVGMFLRAKGWGFGRIDASQPIDACGEQVGRFVNGARNISILLVGVRAGGVGPGITMGLASDKVDDVIVFDGFMDLDGCNEYLLHFFADRQFLSSRHRGTPKIHR